MQEHWLSWLNEARLQLNCSQVRRIAGPFFWNILMPDVRFLEWDELHKLHRNQLELFGGQDGFVDEGVVRSAMARAQFVSHYSEDADLADLAAEYFYGLATTQGYCDGNKRIALAATSAFLQKNGWDMTITDELMYVLAMGIATGTVDRETLARILRDHMEEIE
jgi:death-on-curing protein